MKSAGRKKKPKTSIQNASDSLKLIKSKLEFQLNQFNPYALPEEPTGQTFQFFNDGVRRIDYILVYNISNNDIRRDTFIDNLESSGLEIEEVSCLTDPDIHFIKVHAPIEILMKYAERFEIPIRKFQKTHIRHPIPKFKFLATELTLPNPNSINYKRAIETFSGAKPKSFLTFERSLVVYNLLKRIDFGLEDYDTGIQRLIKHKVFIVAFPLHDGTCRWDRNVNNPLNDRQILSKYWANKTLLYKTLPIDTIGRYYGYNIALYFAWLSFYNKMLILPSILGILVLFINYITYDKLLSIPIDEVCNSNLIICPNCPSCPANSLKYYCMDYRFKYMTDSIFTVLYATAISFWAAVYMVLWKRKQAVYALRWNIQDSELEEQDIRPEFENFATSVRISEFGDAEVYIPFYILAWRMFFTFSFVFFMIILVIGVITSIVIIEMAISHTVNNNMFASLISSLITVAAIMILRRVCNTIYSSIVVWLVNLQVPKTQTDFDNSYILKLFAFSFVNNYGCLIYLAFFKGKGYTSPNDPKMYSAAANYVIDTCDPSGCFSELHTQLGIIMLLMPTLTHTISYFKSRITIWLRRKKVLEANIVHHNIPRWEKDFELNYMRTNDLLMMYEEMVIQFGFVTLFTFAFPLAPLVALLNNSLKTYLDAKFFVLECRRPQCKRSASIGAWFDIMKFLTYLSIFSNACYITFTSDFLNKEHYIYNVDKDMKGYVQHQLSRYIINIDHWPNAGIPNGTECWYSGIRNGPGEVYPYAYRYLYFEILALKFGFIIVFEHLILGLAAILSYSIPDIPQSVKQQYAIQAMELRRKLNVDSSSALKINNLVEKGKSSKKK